jgi:phage N-6-adenine-methyltransferase
VNTELEVPLELWHMLNREFNFSLDVAATNLNKRCRRWFTKEQDALNQKWTCAEGESIWCHPPLGHQLSSFVKKARETGKQHRVVCLLPSKTHAIWWHNYVERQAEVRFLKGRMVFANNKQANSASWCLVIFERK